MSKNDTPVVAKIRISYGPKDEDQIQPGTVFAPADHGLDIKELRALKAVEDCTDADLSLHAAQKKPARRGGRRAAAAEGGEAEGGEAEGGEAEGGDSDNLVG